MKKMIIATIVAAAISSSAAFAAPVPTDYDKKQDSALNELAQEVLVSGIKTQWALDEQGNRISEIEAVNESQQSQIDSISDGVKTQGGYINEIAQAVNGESLKNHFKNQEQDQAISDANTRVDFVESGLVAESDARKAVDDKLQANIDTKASKQALEAQDARQTAALKGEAVLRVEGDAAVLSTSKSYTDRSVSAGVAESKAYTNAKFGELKSQVDKNREKASAGISGVAAMANIPQVSQGSAFSVGAGVGYYDSQQSVAVGVSARINNHVVTKASVAMSTQSDAVFGAGVAVEW